MTSKNIKHLKTRTEIIKELEMRIFEEKMNKKGTKYLINAYEYDIKDIEREISTLSDKNSEEGIELSRVHHAYSIGLKKLKNNINKPVNELLSNGYIK